MSAEQPADLERLKAYTDAVVAIAQTLLILPLLESVSDAKMHHLTAAVWFKENSDLLIWLTMSFFLIWMLWSIHHRVFDHVQHLTQWLLTANLGWMFGVVFFPVATALLGLGETDRTQMLLYIGSLIYCGLMMNVMTFLVVRDARVYGDLPPMPAGRLAASVSSTLLFSVALLLALAFPHFGYKALLILLLSPLLTRLLTPGLSRLAA